MMVRSFRFRPLTPTGAALLLLGNPAALHA